MPNVARAHVCYKIAVNNCALFYCIVKKQHFLKL